MTCTQLSNRAIHIGMSIMLLLMMACIPHPVHAANITASVDRNPVSIDESFTLRLKARGSVDDDPDLSALSKDFDVLGTSQSTSMNYVNGNFSRESIWNITLISKNPGVQTIPSIAFGKDNSPAIRITVNDASAATGAQQDPGIFMEVETDTERTWVQGQLIYTIRLFRNVDINNASLSPPRTSDADAIIEKLGDDVNYEAFRNGIRYDVIERRYAIFPQLSGDLKIEPTRFEGRIGQRRSMFDSMYSNNKIKRMRSQAIKVTIVPTPASIPAAEWLPAKQLSLVEEWSVPLDQLSAGEPVTRTITINASGVLANQIREPDFVDVDGIKQYPDQPQGDNTVSRNGVEATKRIKLALIPAAGGRYTIPAVRLPWWNTDTGQREVAVIPEQVITVSGAAIEASPAPTPVLDESQESSIVSTSEQQAQTRPTPGDDGPWRWISLALAIAWLSTIAIMVRSRKQQGTSTPSLNSLRKRLLDDCARSDANATRKSLLAWARVRWPQQRIHNLMDIPPLVDRDTADALRELNSTLYSSHEARWNGDRLARQLNSLPLRPPTTEAFDDPVEPLYKA